MVGQQSQRHLRRRVLAGFGAFGAWWGAWGALVPSVQVNAGVDDGELGAALLFIGIGALASMRIIGALIDRFGRAVLPLSVLAFAATGLGPGFAQGRVQLAAALFLVGASSGAMDVAINTGSSQYESAAKQPIMNLAHGVFSLGVILASILVGLLRSMQLAPAAILGVLALVFVTVAAWIHLEGRGEQSIGRRTVGRPPTRSRSWAPSPRLVSLGMLTALAYLVENAWQSWSAVHLERTLAARPAVSALGPAVFGAAAAAGRFGGHRLTGTMTRQSLVRRGASVAAVGTLVAAAAPTVPMALVAIAGAGLGTAVCAPSLFSLAGSGVAEGARGTSISTVTTLAYLGFVVGPAVVGLTARLTSLPIALGSVSIAAVILAITADRARGAEDDRGTKGKS